jgi:hypothetical protein
MLTLISINLASRSNNVEGQRSQHAADKAWACEPSGLICSGLLQGHNRGYVLKRRRKERRRMPRKSKLAN